MKKTYTVKDLAERFSVTEMAIHKQLKHDKVKDFVIYENNRKFLTEEGLEVLTTLRNDNRKYSSKAKEEDAQAQIQAATEATEKEAKSSAIYETSYFSNTTESGSDSVLYKQLCKQLEIKDSQINNLTSLLGKQTEQVNVLTHTINHMNGTLQLREVSSITNDMNEINDINIKDIESDIINRFNSAYKPSYNSYTAENVAASNTEKVSNIEAALKKANKNIDAVINDTIKPKASTEKTAEEIVTDIAPKELEIKEEEHEEKTEEIIFSVKEKKEEPPVVETDDKKGFWGKLFSKK